MVVKTKVKKWKYKAEYGKSFIIESNWSDEHAFCTVCSGDISVSQGRMQDITSHVATAKHSSCAKAQDAMPSVSSGSDDQMSVIRAETLLTVFLHVLNMLFGL